jgi:hypothetical protein
MLPSPPVRIISRHLLGQLLGVTLLGALLLAALVFLLQALRLGHHLAGSGAGLSLLGRALLLSGPSLLGFALPLAAGGAVLLVFARLADTRQLLALRAAGASPLQLAAPVLELLLLVGALVLLLGRTVEPAALGRLQGLLAREASVALLGGLQPGRFQALSPELSLFAEERQPGPAPGEIRVRGLFLSRQSPDQQLLAAEARLRSGPQASLEVELHRGELRSLGGGSRVQIRFGKAHLCFALWEGLRPHLGFLEHRALEAPARAFSGAGGTVALGLLMLLVAGRSSRPWRRGVAALAVLVVQQGGLLLVSARFPGPTAALLLHGALCLLALLGWTGLLQVAPRRLR